MKFMNISRHRNGITGTPFHTGIMSDEGKEYMFVQFVDKPQETAVIRMRDGIPDMRVSIRGDYFAEAIQKEIERVKP